MNYTRLQISQQGAVAEVTLNRPDLHNAFDEALIAELTEGFTRLSDDPNVRVVVLKGAGKSFCAGADLTYMGKMAGYSREENLEDARALQRMFAAIAHCPKVTLARVHGAAIGGGAGLVAVCDLAIAAEEATFALSEVRLGLVPAIIGPYVLEKIGMGAARALFVTGERISAQEALRIGLVQQVTPAADLDAALEKKVELARKAGPEAVAAAKRLLRAIAGKTPEEAAETTVECIAALRVSPEGQEGIRAFLEKRKPNFAE
ncbi:MAG TPA: enoyl-CoA hydratase-related protein [Chthonomonadaceae bacterium]|nr:enoyl-CoA hydratase-related protein [Chthonomonadaceae bacterium]